MGHFVKIGSKRFKLLIMISVQHLHVPTKTLCLHWLPLTSFQAPVAGWFDNDTGGNQ